MRTATRWMVVLVLLAHGLIHLLGAAKGLGWAAVEALTEPIGTAAGVLWLTAAVLVVLTAALLAVRLRRWWLVGAVALIVSQAAILSAWGDARAGTLANVVLLAAVVHGYASQGPTSYRAAFDRLAVETLSETPPDAVVTAGDVVTERDVALLPEPLATYVRRSGAVGRPRVVSFRARIHGRIRAGATKPWMSFSGAQVNTYGPQPGRLFFMDATMFGLPVDVLHSFVGPSATMRVKVCSLVPLVNASGPDMDRAETVTLFNDLCILAPAAIVDAAVVWHGVDEHHVRGEFTRGAHTVSADLVFDRDGDLIDFVSDDRLRSSADGREFSAQRWSTPVGSYREFRSRRISSHGEARWHSPDPEGTFTYLEFELDDIAAVGRRGPGRRS